MHTQHFPKTVLFTSQRGQRDRGTAKVLLLVPPKQHGHTSLALQQAGQPLPFNPESNVFTRELKQMAPAHTDFILDPKWNKHRDGSAWKATLPPISAATEPTDHQLKHSQHHQTRCHFHCDGICLKSSNVVFQDRSLLEFIVQHQCRKLKLTAEDQSQLLQSVLHVELHFWAACISFLLHLQTLFGEGPNTQAGN